MRSYLKTGIVSGQYVVAVNSGHMFSRKWWRTDRCKTARYGFTHKGLITIHLNSCVAGGAVIVEVANPMRCGTHPDHSRLSPRATKSHRSQSPLIPGYCLAGYQPAHPAAAVHPECSTRHLRAYQLMRSASETRQVTDYTATCTVLICGCTLNHELIPCP